MALQSSGQISFANIITEFGDSGGGLVDIDLIKL